MPPRDLRPAFQIVREWRRARELTQAEAAERVGVSERTWRRWERPGAVLPVWALKRLAPRLARDHALR